jgi:hypothetical protein
MIYSTTKKLALPEITNVIQLFCLLAAGMISGEICLSVGGEKCNPVT